MITPHSVITIREVANGYIVQTVNYNAVAVVGSIVDEDTMVFQNIGALEHFLREHFKNQPTASGVGR